jgi:hypothetical protein
MFHHQNNRYINFKKLIISIHFQIQSSTVAIDQDKSEDITSTESKSIFETIRDTITHPLTAISEAAQNIASNTTTDYTSSSEKLESLQSEQVSIDFTEFESFLTN